MRIIKQSHEIIQCPSYEDALRICESAGRICYQSHDRITQESSEPFIKNIITRNHLTVIEHISMSVKFITSRAIANELVRHRLASFSQASTRYVNLSGKDIEFIQPYWINDSELDYYLRLNPNGIDANAVTDYQKLPTDIQDQAQYCRISCWYMAMQNAEIAYNSLIEKKLPVQAARGVLPLDLKTELIMTCNLRELRHIFKLRSNIADSGAVHPDMIKLIDPLLDEMKNRFPVFFQNV